MGFKCGIVGLPNVGKSTLFNALTRTAAAQAANFPFCTIEPNVGEVAVPDPRLMQLAEIAQVEAGHPDAADLRRHRGPRPRRLQGRGARQPVPGQHPRGRRHRSRAALLRERRHHACRGPGRPGRRRRDGRDRADAGRSGIGRAPPAERRAKAARRRQGGGPARVGCCRRQRRRSRPGGPPERSRSPRTTAAPGARSGS